MSSSTNSTVKICFNPECKNTISDRWRKGWRLRNYDFAHLCDRCGSIYEEGKFCETFHKYASGWRSCETCGKRIHCGCIVSLHAFVVLDAGGIDCTVSSVCARKNVELTPNPMWPPRPLPGRLTECSIRNCNQTGGSGSPGPWHKPVNLLNKSAACSDFERTYFDADTSTVCERLVCSDQFGAFSSERHQPQNLCFSNGSMKQIGPERLQFGTSVFSGEEMRSCLLNPGHQSLQKDGQSSQSLGLAFSSGFSVRADNQPIVSRRQSQQLSPKDVESKQLTANSHDKIDSSHQPRIRNCKSVDTDAQRDLLPRYCPKISDDQLQQIKESPNSVITPLFEKMLSVSDAGRVGRLVLPKKCAESYFPAILHPEGLPLKVLDVKGDEWTFQFRFWPNNNSRMYVLEGITNCIQSLQLQAGDVVTFSRIEPEGKLMMGFRKASNGSHSEQGLQAVKSGNEIPAVGDDNQKPNCNEDLTNCHIKGYPISECLLLRDQSNSMDMARILSKTDTSYVVKEASGVGSSLLHKRKNGLLSSKRKRSRVSNVDLLELNVTLEEVQGLFRSPADHALHIEIIEGFEFEEFEDAPVIGRPTIIAKNSVGEDVQWVQCDECLKWRKLPSDHILPARWTCSKNSWNPDRSSCDAAQEPTIEQLRDKSTNSRAASKKLQNAAHAPEPLEAFARLAIKDNEPCLGSAQLTTKHPRHKPGCSCIVCVQPPSGTSPKHQQNCTCNVCMMLKRRFRTMMLRRERSQSAKEAANRERNAQDNVQASEKSNPIGKLFGVRTECVNTDEQVTCNPKKGHIDLNIQPERDEEASTCCDSAAMIKMSRSSAERGMCDSGDKINPGGKQSESRVNRLRCDKQNHAVSHRNSDKNSIVENLPPMVHPCTSTSASR